MVEFRIKGFTFKLILKWLWRIGFIVNSISLKAFYEEDAFCVNLVYGWL